MKTIKIDAYHAYVEGDEFIVDLQRKGKSVHAIHFPKGYKFGWSKINKK